MKHYPLNKIIYENNKNKIRKDSLIKKKKKKKKKGKNIIVKLFLKLYNYFFFLYERKITNKH